MHCGMESSSDEFIGIVVNILVVLAMVLLGLGGAGFGLLAGYFLLSGSPWIAGICGLVSFGFFYALRIMRRVELISPDQTGT